MWFSPLLTCCLCLWVVAPADTSTAPTTVATIEDPTTINPTTINPTTITPTTTTSTTITPITTTTTTTTITTTTTTTTSTTTTSTTTTSTTTTSTTTTFTTITPTTTTTTTATTTTTTTITTVTSTSTTTTNTTKSSITRTPPASEPKVLDHKVAIIVGAVLCFLLILLLLFIFIKFQCYKKIFTTRKGSSESQSINKPITISKFSELLSQMQANSHLKFAEEFESLKKVGVTQSKEVAGLEVNSSKNRYSDIKPYDLTRVKVSPNPDDESDYINASWIPGYFSRRQYIATQGPLAATQDDFWRMVWEFNVKAIVMLTKLMENNKLKCHQYWPMDEGMVMYGDVKVTLLSTKVTNHWVLREMLLAVGQQKRVIKHCSFTSWPDMKVPEETTSTIDFIRMTRKCFSVRGSSPLVVHCSAGVGRTGAYIAIDTVGYQMEEDEVVNVYSAVYKMRLNRASMVQNERQYIFIHEVVNEMIKDYLRNKYSEDTTNDETLDKHRDIPLKRLEWGGGGGDVSEEADVSSVAYATAGGRGGYSYGVEVGDDEKEYGYGGDVVGRDGDYGYGVGVGGRDGEGGLWGEDKESLQRLEDNFTFLQDHV